MTGFSALPSTGSKSEFKIVKHSRELTAICAETTVRTPTLTFLISTVRVVEVFTYGAGEEKR